MTLEQTMEADEIKNKVLNAFVTSTSDPIYAIKHNVPPEVFGAFGSYFSRNPKDFREHLWEAITGQIEEQESELNIENLKWLAQGDFKAPSDAIEKGLAQSQDFFTKWYGKYSHKSIANTVWIPMVGTNVSQLFAKELAYDQLAFFIEQSTRYVKFNTESMHKDPDIMKSSHKDIYLKALSALPEAYHKIIELSTEHFKRENPFASWLASQSPQVKESSEKAIRAKYEREVKGAVLDVSRFLLPQATKTNIAWVLDARSTEYDIAAWKGHPIEEIRQCAHLIEKHAGEIAPSLLKYTDENSYYSYKLHGYKKILSQGEPRPFTKGVDIISYDPDSLDKTIAHILKRHNRGGTFSQRYEEAKRLSFNEKISLLRRITEKRIHPLPNGGNYVNEWVEMDEDFDLVKITLEIRTDIGATRDWRRHQKWDRGEPLYTLDNGFHRPYTVDALGPEAIKVFNDAMKIAHETEIIIRKDFPFQAQYVVPMAANHAITMSSGLDQLQYMLYTRTTPEANFSYRIDAFNIAESVAKKMPWLLGYKEYPQGKEFLEVYKNAPLKNIMPLQVGEMALHQ